MAVGLTALWGFWRAAARGLGHPGGLCGQPFWVVSTWRARQWGMLALSLAYALVWGGGVWRFWVLG